MYAKVDTPEVSTFVFWWYRVSMKYPEENMSLHPGAEITSVSPMRGGARICVQSCVPHNHAEVDLSTLQNLPVNSLVVEA